ncbi:TPA: hypothetical protein EYO12_01310 [Candidatus Saccharibacteria bacterium]|nr:hypothetical protein [Candidatus Saccharibacteria bacterium]HIO87357.1 hypothetical protein [Candidatus Saccharibacteria bacterium]
MNPRDFQELSDHLQTGLTKQYEESQKKHELEAITTRLDALFVELEHQDSVAFPIFNDGDSGGSMSHAIIVTRLKEQRKTTRNTPQIAFFVAAEPGSDEKVFIASVAKINAVNGEEFTVTASGTGGVGTQPVSSIFDYDGGLKAREGQEDFTIFGKVIQEITSSTS